MTLIFIVCVGLIEKLIRLAPGNHYPGEHPRVCAPEYQVSIWWSLHGGVWWSIVEHGGAGDYSPTIIPP